MTEDYDRKKRLGIEWLQSVEDCERAGWDGSVEHKKEFLDRAEPELLSLHGFETKDDIKQYAAKFKENTP